MSGYTLLEDGTPEEYMDLARMYPDDLNKIAADAIYYSSPNVCASSFVKEFKLDANAPIFYLSDWNNMTPMEVAMYNAASDEVDVLFQLGATMTDRCWDILFNGRGSYYTWRDPCATYRATEIEGVLTILEKHLGRLAPNFSEWWWSDFCDYVRAKRPNHAYLDIPLERFAELRASLHEEEDA